MADTITIIAYFCENYPHPHELSKSRITKMVYLADWRAAIEYGKPLTGIEWEINHYGPYVDDIIKEARSDSRFKIVETTNMYGKPKVLVKLVEEFDFSELEDAEKEVLDYVIESTSAKYWDDFIEIVYSTYPVVTQERYTPLNLEKLAKTYNKEVRTST